MNFLHMLSDEMVRERSAVGLTRIATVIACLLLVACNASAVSTPPAASSSAHESAIPSTAATPGPAPAFVQTYTTDVSGGNASNLAVADLNEDGNLDVATTSPPFGVIVLFGAGDGKFTAAPDFEVAASAVVRAADLNGDGHMDLVAAGDQIAVLLGKGDGTFAPAVSYAAGSDVSDPMLELLGLDVADLNADTNPDLMAINYVTSELSVLLGKSGGTFEAASRYACPGCLEVASADLDGDGDVDVVAVSPGISATGALGQESVFAFLNDGAGRLSEPVRYNPIGHAATIALGDLNGDGAPDVITGNDSGLSVSVLLGGGDGTFAQAVSYPAGNTHTVAVVDLDADGKLDVLSGSFEDTKVWFYRGAGDGTLIETQGIDAKSLTVRSLVVADFNGDDKLDLALYTLGIHGLTVVSALLGT